MSKSTWWPLTEVNLTDWLNRDTEVGSISPSRKVFWLLNKWFVLSVGIKFLSLNRQALWEGNTIYTERETTLDLLYFSQLILQLSSVRSRQNRSAEISLLSRMDTERRTGVRFRRSRSYDSQWRHVRGTDGERSMCLGFLVHLFLRVEGDSIALILQKNIGQLYSRYRFQKALDWSVAV